MFILLCASCTKQFGWWVDWLEVFLEPTSVWFRWVALGTRRSVKLRVPSGGALASLATPRGDLVSVSLKQGGML